MPPPTLRLRRASRAGIAVLSIALLTSGLAASAADETLEPSGPLPGDPVLIAAGDIACDPRNPAFQGGRGTASLCRQGDIAELIEGLDPSVVLPLGDTQYDHGKRKAYRRSYHPSWGRFKNDTMAVVGNHEYETRGARGFFGYFDDAAGPNDRGYYSEDVGAWHVVVLNSNCWIESCKAGQRQLRWLERDLERNDEACTLAAWHHPRWSSGLHGDDASVAPFLRTLARFDTDVVLNGHDHHYERFRTRAPDGSIDLQGFRQFIVGTGGAQLYPIGRASAKSEVRRKAFGVLQLTLGDGSYDWRFHRLEEGPADHGTATCSS